MARCMAMQYMRLIMSSVKKMGTWYQHLCLVEGATTVWGGYHGCWVPVVSSLSTQVKTFNWVFYLKGKRILLCGGPMSGTELWAAKSSLTALDLGFAGSVGVDIFLKDTPLQTALSQSAGLRSTHSPSSPAEEFPSLFLPDNWPWLTGVKPVWENPVKMIEVCALLLLSKVLSPQSRCREIQ